MTCASVTYDKGQYVVKCSFQLLRQRVPMTDSTRLQPKSILSYITFAYISSPAKFIFDKYQNNLNTSNNIASNTVYCEVLMPAELYINAQALVNGDYTNLLFLSS